LKSARDIQKARGAIDEIDDQLLYLFNQRAETVVNLGRIKRQAGKKLFDPTRERDIFTRVAKKNPGPLPQESVVRLFERIIDESRRLERTEAYTGKEEEE
jgi:chorismate mutase